MKLKQRRWKRGLLLAVPILLGGLVWAQQAASPVGAPLWGDVNGDGQITFTDARLALQIAVGLIQPGDVPRQGLPNGPAIPAQVQRGRYLVVTHDCGGCHNRGVADNPNDPNWLAGFIMGPPVGAPGSFSIGPFNTYAANLTPDMDTGLGKWTALDLFNEWRTGKDKDGHFLCPPMPWPSFRNMSDDDLWAMAAYLKSIKPVTNKVPDSQAPAKFADGSPDWSSAYKDLPPPFPPYPGKNETP